MHLFYISYEKFFQKLEIQINDYLYGLSNSMEVPARQLRKTSSDRFCLDFI